MSQGDELMMWHQLGFVLQFKSEVHRARFWAVSYMALVHLLDCLSRAHLWGTSHVSSTLSQVLQGIQKVCISICTAIRSLELSNFLYMLYICESSYKTQNKVVRSQGRKRCASQILGEFRRKREHCLYIESVKPLSYSFGLQSHPSPFNSVCHCHSNHSKIPLSAYLAFSYLKPLNDFLFPTE